MQKVIPAILTQDSADLRKKLELFHGHSNWMHIDIMDGSFVPGRTVNLFELGEASEFFNLEIHLMVEDPFKYFEDCSGIRAKRVLFHAEAVEEKEQFFSQLNAYEFQKGIVLNLETSPEVLPPFSHKISSILLMGVEPGLQGRPFNAAVLPKAEKIRAMYPHDVRSRTSDIFIGIDGGISRDNIREVFTKGADYVVVGSEIWKSEDPIEVFKSLEEMVQ